MKSSVVMPILGHVFSLGAVLTAGTLISGNGMVQEFFSSVPPIALIYVGINAFIAVIIWLYLFYINLWNS